LVRQFLPLSTKVPALNPPQNLALIANNTGHIADLPHPFNASYVTGSSTCFGCTLLKVTFPIISSRGIATRKQVTCTSFGLEAAERTLNASLLFHPPKVWPGLTFRRHLFYTNTKDCSLKQLEDSWLLNCSFFNGDNGGVFDKINLLLTLTELNNVTESARVLLLNSSAYQPGIVNPTTWRVFDAEGFWTTT
jgi:hypothetical protein